MLTLEKANEVFESGGTVLVNGTVVLTLKDYCNRIGADFQFLPIADEAPQTQTIAQLTDGLCVCGGDGVIESWFNPENSRACMVCNESNKK